MSNKAGYHLLCIGNGGFSLRAEGLYVNQHTTRFLDELAGRLEQVIFSQPIHPRNLETLNDSLVDDRRISLLPFFPYGRFSWAKRVSYATYLPFFLKNVQAIDGLYLFMPGTLSRICGSLAIALRKPYGIYLRGEVGTEDRLYKFLLRHAKFTLATGAGLAAWAAQCCEKVEVVTPMLDITRDDLVHSRAQRACGPWTLLFVGCVETRKGIDELLAMAHNLHDLNLDFRLLIVGGGNWPYFEKLVDSTLRRKVSFLGQIADRRRLREFYAAADLFIFPSHLEGFPRVLYEAMTFGVPILTTFVGSIPSVMRHDENCWRIPVKNPQALSASVTGLLERVEVRERLAREGKETMRKLLGTWKESHANQVCRNLQAFGANL